MLRRLHDYEQLTVHATNDELGSIAHLQASDGEIGHVDDLLIDDDTWQAPYLLIDTSNWPGGGAGSGSPSSICPRAAPQDTLRNSRCVTGLEPRPYILTSK